MVSSDEVRLTELAQMAGCTGKAGADAVSMVLQLLASNAVGRIEEPDELLVGLRAPDDAAVYRLNDEQALVLTIDFFAPLVDDPYAYGAIAAANALSDIYAMGGEVALALNISGFPIDMPEQTVAEILRGGADKVAEAGGIIAGGHTLIDAEPKYGLCAIGFAHPDRLLRKGGARPGDLLYLTKPIGTGVITTAAKFQEAEETHLRAAIDSMVCLNRTAARVAAAAGATALTDVTGFGLLGYAHELAESGEVGLHIEASAVPLLPGAMQYAYRGTVTGGGMRNRSFLEDKARISEAVDDDLGHLLVDPQTSGGLLFAVPPERAAELERAAADAGLGLWRIGEARTERGVSVVA